MLASKVALVLVLVVVQLFLVAATVVAFEEGLQVVLLVPAQQRATNAAAPIITLGTAKLKL